MFTKEEIELIKRELPSRAVTELAKETGISRPTIYRFFEGKKVKSYLQETIYLAALRVIEKHQKRKSYIRLKMEKVFPKGDNHVGENLLSNQQ